METVLYHYWLSSSSWRVRWALAIKGVPFRSEIIDLRAGEQQKEAHRARNPLGYVPTLHIDGKDLGESVAIIEYLEARFPAPALYPRDPWVAARVRQFVELINSGVQPMQNLEVLKRISPEMAGQREWAAHFNARGMAACERLLTSFQAEGLRTNSQFVVGDTLTAADLFLVPQVFSARRYSVDVTPYVHVLAAEKAALANEHAQGALPENQPGAPFRDPAPTK